jgi:type IV secretory pathway TraG/TraD family ATPase VirD4
LSKTLGKKTVATVGQGTSISMSPGGGSSSTSTNYGKTGRELLMPDEILQLGRNTAILLGPNSKPRFLRTVDYWNLTKSFAHLEKRYPSMYWKPPITWDENPFPH